jgi:hypothetical protein
LPLSRNQRFNRPSALSRAPPPSRLPVTLSIKGLSSLVHRQNLKRISVSIVNLCVHTYLALARHTHILQNFWTQVRVDNTRKHTLGYGSAHSAFWLRSRSFLIHTLMQTSGLHCLQRGSSTCSGARVCACVHVLIRTNLKVLCETRTKSSMTCSTLC